MRYVGQLLVSRTGDADDPKAYLKHPNQGSCRHQKSVGRSGQQDGGHGSRISAKKCVTTYLPNLPASKMDDAQALCL